MPDVDGSTAIVADPGEAGSAEPQSGGTDEVAALRAQVTDLQKRLDSIPQSTDTNEQVRRAQFDATAQAALVAIQRMPEGAEKDRERNRLHAAALAEKERRLDYTNEQRENTFKATVAQQRDNYITEKGRELGLTADEIRIIKAAARAENAMDSETVDGLIAPFEKRARAGTGEQRVPSIARVRTDSGTATSGAQETYQDLLRQGQERMKNGERISLRDIRREAAAKGILPRRLGA